MYFIEFLNAENCEQFILLRTFLCINKIFHIIQSNFQQMFHPVNFVMNVFMFTYDWH